MDVLFAIVVAMALSHVGTGTTMVVRHGDGSSGSGCGGGVALARASFRTDIGSHTGSGPGAIAGDVEGSARPVADASA